MSDHVLEPEGQYSQPCIELDRDEKPFLLTSHVSITLGINRRYFWIG